MSSQPEIEQKLARIKQAIRERQPDVARQLLIDVLKADPQNAEAWFVSSFLIKDPVAQLEAAQRALAINPNFAAAQKRMQELQARQKGPTPLASVFDQELEESASITPPSPMPTPTQPPVFNNPDDATAINAYPVLDDAPFTPSVPKDTPAFDDTRPAESTGAMPPLDATRQTPLLRTDSPFTDATVVTQRPSIDEVTPVDDEAHASEKFPFDETGDVPVNDFSFDEPVDAPADVFSFDNPPLPTTDDFSFLDEPPAPRRSPTQESFEDLLKAKPDSARAIADADALLLDQPFNAPSSGKRPKSGQKADHVPLDKPYDPSVKQPKLPSAHGAKGGKAQKRAVKAAKQRSQNQSLLLLLLSLMLIFVVIAGAVILLRPRLGSLFGGTTETSQPVLAATVVPTTTLIPTDVPPTTAPVLAPTSVPDTPIPTLTPTDVPPQAATSLPPTQTVTPLPSATTASGSTQVPTAQTTAVGSNAQATPAQAVAANDTQTLTAFRDRIVKAKALIRSTDFPRLGAANAGQIVPLARIAIPGLFSVIFHDGQPTLIFQTSGFAARDSATFAIAGLLDDQPLMRVSIQTASALGSILLSSDQKKMVSVSANSLTVVDPASARVLHTIQNQNSTSALSPDGHYAATASNNAATVTLWNIDTGTLERTITLDGMTSDRGPNSLVFSADSQVLAVGGCDGSIRVVSVASGESKTIQSDGGLFDCFDVMSVSPDGGYVLAADNAGFGRFRTVDTSTLSNLSYPGLDANPRPKVALSADGELVAAMNADFLLLWDFASGKELARQRLGDVTRIDGLTFSADGRFLVAATHGAFDGVTWWGIASGPLSAPATATIQAQTARVTATADALAAAMRGSGRVVFARPVDGTHFGLFGFQAGASSATLLTQLLPSPDGGLPFSLSADGKQIAFVNPTGVAVADSVTGATPTVVAASGENPLLSPDGHYVFFRQSDGQCGMARVDGGESIPFGGQVECNLTSAVWSPDSQSLSIEQIYSRPTESNSAATATKILLMQVSPTAVSAPVMVGPDSPRALDPAYRPDGQLTYLMFDVTAKSYALFTSASGSKNATLLTTIPGNSTYHSHVWSPDGERVALVEATAPEQVLILNADGSAVAHLPGDELYTQVDSLAWSPDGRFIAASRSTRDHTQARIFVYSADGTTSAPLADGIGALWLPQ